MANIKSYTLSDLTQHCEVTIQGDPHCLIHGVCTIQASKPGHITFLNNPLYKKYLASTQASAVILSPDEAADCQVNAIISKDPYYTYTQIAAFFDQRVKPKSGLHPTSVIGEGCEIHPTASIGAQCVLGNRVKIGAHVSIGAGSVIGDECSIDEGSHLHAHVTLYHQVTIGKRVIVASGVVIGSDGFGIAKHKGVWNKVPQLGGVIIKDDVEIGANCAIDRGAIDDTIIESGVKLDNLIQVGHNVKIGKNTAMAGCVAIGGSAIIGQNCLIGGGSAVNGHITVADNAVITGMTAVTKSIKEPGIYSSGVGGLVTNMEWRKNSARVHRLEQLMERIKDCENALQELTERN